MGGEEDPIGECGGVGCGFCVRQRERSGERQAAKGGEKQHRGGDTNQRNMQRGEHSAIEQTRGKHSEVWLCTLSELRMRLHIDTWTPPAQSNSSLQCTA